MNWDNQNNNKDPWGRNNNDGPDFDDLIKRFSMIFGNKGSSNGGCLLYTSPSPRDSR